MNNPRNDIALRSALIQVDRLHDILDGLEEWATTHANLMPGLSSYFLIQFNNLEALLPIDQSDVLLNSLRGLLEESMKHKAFEPFIGAQLRSKLHANSSFVNA